MRYDILPHRHVGNYGHNVNQRWSTQAVRTRETTRTDGNQWFIGSSHAFKKLNSKLTSKVNNLIRLSTFSMSIFML